LPTLTKCGHGEIVAGLKLFYNIRIPYRDGAGTRGEAAETVPAYKSTVRNTVEDCTSITICGDNSTF